MRGAAFTTNSPDQEAARVGRGTGLAPWENCGVAREAEPPITPLRGMRNPRGSLDGSYLLHENQVPVSEATAGGEAASEGGVASL